MNRTPWHGVLVATPLPWTTSHDTPTWTPTPRTSRWLAGNGCDGVTPTARSASTRTSPTTSAPRGAHRGRGRTGRFTVMPGVGAYGAAQARRQAEHAAEAGAPP